MSRDTRGWFVVVCSIIVVASAVNLQMPLFPQYAAMAGFGNTGRALLFAAYIMSLVPALALAGGASDALGRRPVVLAAIGSAALATLAMILWPNVYVMLVARLFQGVAVALGLGSSTAWLTERLADPKRAAWWSSVAVASAFGGGGLLTTIVVALFGGDLTPWSYHLGLAMLVLIGVLVWRVPGGTTGSGGAWLRLPSFPAGTRLFTLGSALSWSVSGIILAQGPAAMAKAGLPTGGGIGVFVLCGAGALVQLIPQLRLNNPRTGMLVGACCSTAGLVLFDLGVRAGDPTLLLAGYASAGAAGFGFMYLAGLTAVNAAAGDRRAAAVAGFLLGSYTGFGIPCMILAWVADHIGETTALGWGAGLAALAFTILLLVVRARSTPAVAARPAG